MSVFPDSFLKAARQCWTGWETVTAYLDPTHARFVVSLTVSTKTLDASINDYRGLVGRLLTDAQLHLFAKRVELNRRAHGLRGYGKRRRARSLARSGVGF